MVGKNSGKEGFTVQGFKVEGLYGLRFTVDGLRFTVYSYTVILVRVILDAAVACRWLLKRYGLCNYDISNFILVSSSAYATLKKF